MCKAERYLSGDEMVAVATSIYNCRFRGQKVCGRDDLISEGVCGLIEAGETYDCTKGKFLTYGWICAFRKMLYYYKNEKKNSCAVSLDDVSDYGYPFEGACIGDENVNTDGLDGDMIIGMLLSAIKKNFGKGFSIINSVVRGKTQEQVAKEYGVSRQRINTIFNDVKKQILKKYTVKNGNVCEKG